MPTARWKRGATAAGIVLAALLLGLGSAWWVLKKATWMNRAVSVGAWSTSLEAGSARANLYTRAVVAMNGLLALGSQETMYFVARADDTGLPLRASCSYRISGVAPAARWWSITAYADDMFLFDAPNQHYSLNATTAALDAQGRFMLATGQQETPGLFWLPTLGDRGLVLTLRLYNPDITVQKAPASLQVPSITPLGNCA